MGDLEINLSRSRSELMVRRILHIELLSSNNKREEKPRGIGRDNLFYGSGRDGNRNITQIFQHTSLQQVH